MCVCVLCALLHVCALLEQHVGGVLLALVGALGGLGDLGHGGDVLVRLDA